MSINSAFRYIFGTGMDLITDDEAEIQSLLDVNNATRAMSFRRLGEHESNPDPILAQALSPRRLKQGA